MKVIEQRGAWKGAARFENSKGLLFSTDKNKPGKELPTDKGGVWVPINVGLANLYVRSLAAWNGILYVGTEGGGIFRYDEKANRWTAVNSELTNSYITSLAASGTTLYAGTEDGIFRLDTQDKVWKSVNVRLRDRHITALAMSGKTIYAGTWGGKVFRSMEDIC